MSSTDLPNPCGIAFKEWAGVRDALASGRQSIILRKGGIHEGPRGFIPEYPAFWIYPTHIHEQEQGLKTEPTDVAGQEPVGVVSIDTYVQVKRLARIERFDELEQLASEHVWTNETTRKRFEYRRPGLWLLVVRVFVSSPPWAVEVTQAHAGCKTWVPLETSLPTDKLTPALTDLEFERTLERIERILPQGSLVRPTDPDHAPEEMEAG